MQSFANPLWFKYSMLEHLNLLNFKFLLFWYFHWYPIDFRSLFVFCSFSSCYFCVISCFQSQNRMNKSLPHLMISVTLSALLFFSLIFHVFWWYLVTGITNGMKNWFVSNATFVSINSTDKSFRRLHCLQQK